MENYLDGVDLNTEEPPDLPPVADADTPDVPDLAVLPDLTSADFEPPEQPDFDEPPDEYLPPSYLLDMPEPVLEALRHSGWQEDIAPAQMSFLDEPPVAAADIAQAGLELDSRAALEAELADVLRQLEQIEANENPIERAFALDELGERQAALEEEIQGLGVDMVQQPDLSLPAESISPEPGELLAHPALDTPGGDDPSDELTADAGLQSGADPGTLPANAYTALWDRYMEAVVNDQNPGGSEAALVQRAEEMNLVDARFVGYSDPAGHHVGAVELAVDPVTGQQFGQILDIEMFQEQDQAAALYQTLQSQVADNSLPNYAVADYASFAALSLGNELNWQQATDLHLALVVEDIDAGPMDEPPVPMMDNLIQEFAGVDLSTYGLESTFEYDPEPDDPGLQDRLDGAAVHWGAPISDQPPLSLEEELAYYREMQLPPADEPPLALLDPLLRDYTGVDLSAYPEEGPFDFEPERSDDPQYVVRVEADPDGKAYLGLGKEWDGGPRAGGDEAYRLVSVYESVDTAQAVAHDLVKMQRDVEHLMGDTVAGYQALASMAYEIGVAAEFIQPGDPLFADQPSDAPLDPFQVQPTEELFAQYGPVQNEVEVDVTREPQHDDVARSGPDLEF